MCSPPTLCPTKSPDPSPGRSMTQARSLYVSRIANFRSSNRPHIRGSAHGPFSLSCKKVNTCEDSVCKKGNPCENSVFVGFRDTRPSCKKANSCEDSVFGPADVRCRQCAKDGAFGSIVSSDDSLQWRVSPKAHGP